MSITNSVATNIVMCVTLCTYVNASLELTQKNGMAFSKDLELALSRYASNSFQVAGSHIRAAISPYFCHHFIVRSFYLKGKNNISLSLAFLQLIVRLHSYYIFIYINHFFRIFPHFLLDCLFFLLIDLLELFFILHTHPLSVIFVVIIFWVSLFQLGLWLFFSGCLLISVFHWPVLLFPVPGASF